MEEKLQLVQQILRSGMFDDLEEVMLLKDLEQVLKDKLGKKDFDKQEDEACESCSA